MAWDKAELERLRARYADDPGGRMHDPKFGARRRAGLQPRRAAGALRRRADLPDRAATAASTRRRPTSPGLDVAISGVPVRPRRLEPRRHPLRAARGPDDRAGRALQPRPRLRADLRHRGRRRRRRALLRAATTSPPSHREIEAWIDGDRRAGGAAAQRRRRPFDHLSDPARRRRATRRSGSSTSTRIPTPAGRSTGCARTTARRSATPSSPACSIRRGPCRSGCAARPSISTSSRPTAA